MNTPQSTFTGDSGFISMQLAYSTADIEQNLFYSAEHAFISQKEPAAKMALLVVNGDVYRLEDDSPPFAMPFAGAQGLLQIVGLDRQQSPAR